LFSAFRSGADETNSRTVSSQSLLSSRLCCWWKACRFTERIFDQKRPACNARPHFIPSDDLPWS